MPAKEPQTVILVSMDGMPWNLISGKFANTPNLDRVAKKGVKAEYIKTVVPVKHGLLTNPSSLVYTQRATESCRTCFGILFMESARQQTRDGVECTFGPALAVTKKCRVSTEKPICKLNCSDVDPKELPNLRNKTRNRVDRVMSWLKSDDPPRFVALYIDQPDWKGHSGGALSQEYKESIEQVDRDAVGYLLDQLRRNRSLTNDHNMVNTSSKRVILLDQYIDSSTYTLTESGSIGHIWPNEGKLDEIYNNLTKPKTPDHLTVYKKEDIPEDYHWKHNRRIPPIYVEPDVGWSVFMSNATVEPGKWVRGNHGWPPQKAETYSILFAQGPAFKVGYEIEPFSILDLYPMMCDLLGIEPRPNNGSMSIIKKMYKEEESPTAGQRSVVTWSSRALVACTAAVVALISL
ncbi:hypothetical protein OS493_028845 [Desmophyllum pertusum]|uniref:Uncharacterized protein n=1 Tax=Desmophyllum pertusum TaxID=174260 RepID=A0A9X0D7Z6_9CNID|nr:hypothetical protein OS493_028845 [Desmophyllum pertusum]